MTYGYGCKAHNDFMDDVCKTLTDTAPGEANDWCKEKWCIVDPQNCAFKTGPGRAVAYSAATDDYFSYETCDPDNFDGNGWIGRVACTDKPNSFCTADVNTEMAGDSSCPCILPAQTQAVADGKPAYVNGTTYGYGCKAHNDFMDDVCKTLTDTAPGEANDWCKENGASSTLKIVPSRLGQVAPWPTRQQRMTTSRTRLATLTTSMVMVGLVVSLAQTSRTASAQRT